MTGLADRTRDCLNTSRNAYPTDLAGPVTLDYKNCKLVLMNLVWFKLHFVCFKYNIIYNNTIFSWSLVAYVISDVYW